MYVFFDAEGWVSFTARGQRDLTDGRKDWVEVADQDLGDLTAWRVLDGALQRVDLAPMKRDAVTAANSMIGDIRRNYLTALPGQEMIYLRKEAEAVRYLADAAPDLAAYPLLSAETGITAESPWQLAQIWLAMADQWTSLAADLEKVRMAALAEIEAAASADRISEALATLSKSLKSIK